jgi:hypothetical protein
VKRDQEKVSRQEKDGEPYSNGEVLGKKSYEQSKKNYAIFKWNSEGGTLIYVKQSALHIFFRFKAKRKETRAGFAWGFRLPH